MVVVAGGGVKGGGDIEGGASAGCGAVCFEPDGIETKERWVYKGAGMGSYAQVGQMEMVGAGKGDFEKEKAIVASGSRCRTTCIGLICFAFLLTIGITLFWLFQDDRGQADACDSGLSGGQISTIDLDPAFKVECCSRGYQVFCEVPPPKPADKIVVHDKYYTHVKNVHVPHMVPVPIPPPPRQVITHKVYVHTAAYDCNAGLNDWKTQWTHEHQRYCCYKSHVACVTKVSYRPHYHTITNVKHVTVPVPEPIPAPPPRVINHVVNVPIHDAPQVIKVPVPGQPHVVPKYVHEKHYVPVPEPSPPTYHKVPVPVPVQDPGKVVKVPVPLPPKTVVENKVLYRTKHVKIKHVYDCDAGFENWKYGWSSAKQSWCCSHETKGCPGSWHGAGLTKSVVTHVTQGVAHGPTYHYSGHYVDSDSPDVVHVHHVHHYYHGDDAIDASNLDASNLDASADADAFDASNLDASADADAFDASDLDASADVDSIDASNLDASADVDSIDASDLDASADVDSIDASDLDADVDGDALKK